MLTALAFFVFRSPGRIFECFRIVLNSFSRPQYLAKMMYVFLSSIRLAYRFRGVGIGLVRADFLHTEALAARFLGILLQLPYALTVYTVFTHYPLKVVDELVREASFLVVDTIQVKNFLEAMGIPAERIHLIRNGVSINEFPERSKNVTPGLQMVLGAGSLLPKKGFHVLLSACALLRQRGIEFRCVIIGDGYERKRLEDLIEVLGLRGSVEMVGYVNKTELRMWYYRAAIFAIPWVVTV